jgi:spore germination protein GerM
LEYHFTVKASDYTKEYKVNGLSDGVVTDLEHLSIEFPNVLNSVEENMEADYARLEYYSERASGWTEIIGVTDIQTNVVFFGVDMEGLRNEGQYRLILPENAFILENGAAYSKEDTVEFTYQVPQGDFISVYPTAGSKVTELSKFEISFLQASKVTSKVSEFAPIELYLVPTDKDNAYVVEKIAPANVKTQDSTLIVTLAEPINYDHISQYELRIPAEAYELTTTKGITARDLALDYEVVLPDVQSVAPSDGAKVASLQEFEIRFNKATKATWNFSRFDRDNCPTLSSTATGSATSFDTLMVSAAENSLLLKLKSPISYVGTYTLTIPAGLYDKVGDNNSYGSLHFTYEVSATALTQAYELTPTGDTVHTLSPIVLTFPNVMKVDTVNLESDYIRVETEDKRGGYDEVLIDTIYTTANALYIAINDADIHTGHYAVTIPEGALLLDSVKNNAIADTLYFEVLVPEFTLTVSPSDTAAVAQVDTIALTVGGVDAVAFNTEGQYFTVLVGEEVYLADTAIVVDSTLNLVFNQPLTAAGEYTLYIPADVIEVNGIKVPEVTTVTFTIDPTLGIATVARDLRRTGIIYNLRGVRVERQSLTPGLYIIDGKKVQLR